MLKGLNSPNGVAFSKGTLYVAERHRITRLRRHRGPARQPARRRKVVIDNLDPTKQAGHFWKFLAMGPDGKLYFNIGAPGNIVMPNYMQATINRVDPKTGVMESVRAGRAQLGRLRLASEDASSSGSPTTRATGSATTCPNDTLHRVARKKGMNFGYPFCHQGDFLDPEFGKGRSCKEFDAPAAKLGAHIAPLGMRFYTGKMFPAEYRNNMFIAHARLVEPHDQAGLQRDARRASTARASVEDEAVPRRLPHRREGRPADVGPPGRRAA